MRYRRRAVSKCLSAIEGRFVHGFSVPLETRSAAHHCCPAIWAVVLLG
jgi:hypothetical protein